MKGGGACAYRDAGPSQDVLKLVVALWANVELKGSNDVRSFMAVEWLQ